MRIHVGIITLSLLLSSFAWAHHGKKYLVTGSHELSAPGTWHVLFSSEYKPQVHGRNYGIEPGILYGISRSWDIEFHTHYSTERGPLRIEAIAVESRIGLLGNYAENEETLGDIREQSHFGITLLVELEKGFGYENQVEGRLIAGGEFEATSYAVNLAWKKSFGETESDDIRYAMGLKRSLLHDIGIGVEVEGGFKGLRDIQWTPGIYVSPSEKLDLKIGASFGVRGLTEDQVLRTSLILRL